MSKTGIMQLAAAIGLAGWTTLAGAGLLSATGPIIAIVADEVFVGEATGYINGAGTLAIQSQKNPDLMCVGQFTSGADKGGTGQMNCTDGSTAHFEFKRLSVLTGHGTGTFSRGALSFAYGLNPEEAQPYLKLPAGKKLAYNGTRLEIAGL